MSEKFRVIVKNDILGDSEDIMSMGQIKKFNKCAMICAKQCIQDGKQHSMGMWTVELINPESEE